MTRKRLYHYVITALIAMSIILAAKVGVFHELLKPYITNRISLFLNANVSIDRIQGGFLHGIRLNRLIASNNQNIKKLYIEYIDINLFFWELLFPSSLNEAIIDIGKTRVDFSDHLLDPIHQFLLNEKEPKTFSSYIYFPHSSLTIRKKDFKTSIMLFVFQEGHPRSKLVIYNEHNRQYTYNKFKFVIHNWELGPMKYLFPYLKQVEGRLKGQVKIKNRQIKKSHFKILNAKFLSSDMEHPNELSAHLIYKNHKLNIDYFDANLGLGKIDLNGEIFAENKSRLLCDIEGQWEKEEHEIRFHLNDQIISPKLNAEVFYKQIKLFDAEIQSEKIQFASQFISFYNQKTTLRLFEDKEIHFSGNFYLTPQGFSFMPGVWDPYIKGNFNLKNESYYPWVFQGSFMNHAVNIQAQSKVEQNHLIWEFNLKKEDEQNLQISVRAELNLQDLKLDFIPIGIQVKPFIFRGQNLNEINGYLVYDRINHILKCDEMAWPEFVTSHGYLDFLKKELSLSLNFENIDFSKYLFLIKDKPDLTVSGVLNGHINVYGDWSYPITKGQLNLVEGQLKNFDYHQAIVNLEGQGPVIDFVNSRLFYGENQAAIIQGYLDFSDENVFSNLKFVSDLKSIVLRKIDVGITRENIELKKEEIKVEKKLAENVNVKMITEKNVSSGILNKDKPSFELDYGMISDSTSVIIQVDEDEEVIGIRKKFTF